VGRLVLNMGGNIPKARGLDGIKGEKEKAD
jgi:hypothetical protein